MNNSDKTILDLCGGTGAWSRPYKKAGYDVRVITLPEHDVCSYEPPENVYGILAAPPCTEFTKASWNIPLKDRDLEAGMKIVKTCLEIIWLTQYDCGQLKFWTLENPTAHLRKFLGHPKFSFQGWQFKEINDRWSTKRYDIWGYFNIPTIPTKRRPLLFVPFRRKSAPAWNRISDVPDWLKGTKLSKSDLRSITPPGFAQAFFKANQ